MECCEAAPPRQVQEPGCPGCGARGRRVRSGTLAALLCEGVRYNDEPYRFCATVGCDVVWFGEATGHALPLEASRVRIGQKETGADRPLCYCFGYRAGDLAEDPHIPDAITDRCRRGEHRCPETNPQGGCCLGNVRAAAKALSGDG